MNLFKKMMEIISGLGFVDLKQDEEMRVASFTIPRDNIRNSVFLRPLINEGLIPRDVSVGDFDQQRKVPLEFIENGRKFWRALLIMRNEDTVILVVSASKGQP